MSDRSGLGRVRSGRGNYYSRRIIHFWVGCWVRGTLRIPVHSVCDALDLGLVQPLIMPSLHQVHTEQTAMLEASLAAKAKSAQQGLRDRLRAQRYFSTVGLHGKNLEERQPWFTPGAMHADIGFKRSTVLVHTTSPPPVILYVLVWNRLLLMQGILCRPTPHFASIYGT